MRRLLRARRVRAVTVSLLALATIGSWPAALAPQAAADPSFTSIFTDSDPRFTGAGWAACTTPITWEVDASALTSGQARQQIAAIRWALGEWSQVSGLTFSYAGSRPLTFNESAFTLRGNATAQDRHISIAFLPDRESTRLTSTAVGMGSPSAVLASRNEITTGTAIFSTDYLDDASRNEARALVLHELGHVLGLGHTDDAEQVMAATLDADLTLGSGDIEGIRSLTKACAA